MQPNSVGQIVHQIPVHASGTGLTSSAQATQSQTHVDGNKFKIQKIMVPGELSNDTTPNDSIIRGFSKEQKAGVSENSRNLSGEENLSKENVRLAPQDESIQKDYIADESSQELVRVQTSDPADHKST